MKYLWIVIVMIVCLTGTVKADFDAELCSLVSRTCELFEPNAAGELWFETRSEATLKLFASEGWRGTDDRWQPVGRTVCVDDINEIPHDLSGETIVFWRSSEGICLQGFTPEHVVYMPVLFSK